jgi:hypothetical protein
LAHSITFRNPGQRAAFPYPLTEIYIPCRMDSSTAGAVYTAICQELYVALDIAIEDRELVDGEMRYRPPSASVE